MTKRGRLERRLTGIVEAPLVTLFSVVGLGCAILARGVPLIVNAVEILLVGLSVAGGFLLSRR